MTKAKGGVLWLTALAVALGSGLPVAEAKIEGRGDIPTGAPPVKADSDWGSPHRGDSATAALQTTEAGAPTQPPPETGTFEKIARTDFETADFDTLVPDVGNRRSEPAAAHRASVGADPVVGPRFERTAAGTGLRLPIKEGAPDDRLTARRPPLRLTIPRTDPYYPSASDPAAPTHGQLAQFRVPQPGETTREAEREGAAPLPSDLTFSYAYGSDSEITYRKNSDLNRFVRDNSTNFAPTVFGLVDYRPTAWLESRLEGTFQMLIPVHEERQITLPSGDIVVPRRKTQYSLLIDQAYVTIKNITAPFEFTAGRRNFEDPRLWLYDAALDAFIVKLKQGDFQTEASVSRENLWDLDTIANVPRGRVDNYIWYTEYRGIEDQRVAGYAIYRFDNTKPSLEGRPFFMGVRAYGRPSDEFNYWAELGVVRGKDELRQKLSGYAFDVGFTYRFPDLALSPNFTLGFAFGSGDGNPADTTNTAFRQTGLQSNEGRFGGVTQFKYYGEALDPELSNLEIFTAGIGFRLLPNAFVDLVYHHYRLNRFAEELRGSAITALMNQGDTPLSKHVGNEFDVILGFRNLFGLRRLGFEVRAGWFFPGSAFLRNDGDETNPIIRKADKAVSILAVIIF